ncbi:MAG TPA: hypothetical protein DD477_10910 [Spirochaetaceae bacterium]|nr:hypothetical protein [Spirochaetaceae bacterium]HAW85619.1 hypothetical protein [Spirochaetaceae bacterium]HBO41709.1 hypothetical protein [Spirochaetaceae bacterium]HCQ86110.1 hypothetical protein [Spirochaetaceae bacterium]
MEERFTTTNHQETSSMKKYLIILAAAAFILAACANPVVTDLNSEATQAEKTEIDRSPVRAINLSTPDAYENDDTQSVAKLIASDGSIQEHNFYDDANDWLKFSAVAGQTYVIETWVLGVADTVLYVYDGSSKKATNDDKSSSDYGSRISFTAPSTKTYTIKVYSYNNKKGTNRGYSVSVTGPGTPPPGGEITLPQPNKQWTVLVYLDADNNLASYGAKDVLEMQAVGSSLGLNIVVLWDNMASNHGYYYIEQGKATLLRDIGEPNMGNPQTAMNFIDWAELNFPADKFMWVYWNHGGAVDRGVAWDDTDGGDHLSEVEQSQIMNYALQVLGKPFEAVGFDACLMATGEIFYQYRNFARYMAASEQTEPGDGWDWKFLSVLKSNPAADGAVATKAIFDYYKTWYASQSDVTFSTVNLAYAGQLGTALHNFSAAAIASGVAGSTYRSLATSLPNFSGYTKDIVGYMNAILGSTAVPQTVKDKATIVKNLIVQNLVLNNWCDSTWLNKAFGAAITLKSDTTVYSQLDLCVDTQWDEFLTFAGFTSAY